MSAWNPFEPDAWSLTTLTAAIQKLPYVPQRIADLGIFEEMGIATLDCAIEEDAGTFKLLTIEPRGTPGEAIADDKRKARPIRLAHIPARTAVTADEVQGIRMFGSEMAARTIEDVRNRKLIKMQRSMDYTIEAHRVAAIKGNYYDHNGSLVSLFTEFEVTQQTQALGLHSTNRSQIRNKMFTVAQKVEDALQGTPYTELRVLCGDTLWAALIDDKDTRDTYLNQAAANELRGDPMMSFTAFGAVWERYRGTSAVGFGDDAYVIPRGIPDLFITRFGPADYIDTVNTMGIPYYARGEIRKFNKGVDIEGQSNPINLCTRPDAVIKLTIS